MLARFDGLFQPPMKAGRMAWYRPSNTPRKDFAVRARRSDFLRQAARQTAF